MQNAECTVIMFVCPHFTSFISDKVTATAMAIQAMVQVFTTYVVYIRLEKITNWVGRLHNFSILFSKHAFRTLEVQFISIHFIALDSAV